MISLSIELRRTGIPAVAALAALLGLAGVAAAQVTPPPAEYSSPLRDGAAVTDSLPARLPHLDLADLMAETPGSFLFDFGNPGWPDGWSPWRLAPHQPALFFEGIPFEQLFSRRPSYNLVPMAVLAPPVLGGPRSDRTTAPEAVLRPFAGGEPATELKFWRGGGGLESIDAVHAQHRRRPLFGRPGFLNAMGTYSGRGADGDYPGSRLQRARQVLLRVRYEQEPWSVEILDLHNRRRVGAHGGVIPPIPGNFESIYFREFAGVEDENAVRKIIRNDLLATVRARLFSGVGSLSSLTVYWTSENFRYTDPPDTLGANSDRLGFSATHPLRAGERHALRLRVEGWTEDVDRYTATTAGDLQVGDELHASLIDSVDFGTLSLLLGPSVHIYGGSVHPGGLLWARSRLGPAAAFARVALAGQPSSPLERSGFGSIASRLEESSGRVLTTRAGVHLRARSFDLVMEAFGVNVGTPRDFFVEGDSVHVLQAPSAFRFAGVAIRAGWRAETRRGLYATISPMFSRLLNGSASALHERTAASQPEAFVRGRLGARLQLFRGDLDVNAYVEGLAWSSMRSRTLHPETGLLVVPESSSRVFGGTGIINAAGEIGLREAKLFLVYENVLAGTELMAGNLIVPVYPLPAQRFRFGVFWPIFG